eukprot:TRINITY_DN10261_c0_g1_i1.p1 TRINITY_DN10261_c0_g1~~TRINITY_DN10261_c0_g1_i1.p1  ORF type:complete len:255 (+),score=23.65 TRINITY_DN10261_c0_g1_i1:62-766(+)
MTDSAPSRPARFTVPFCSMTPPQRTVQCFDSGPCAGSRGGGDGGSGERSTGSSDECVPRSTFGSWRSNLWDMRKAVEKGGVTGGFTAALEICDVRPCHIPAAVVGMQGFFWVEWGVCLAVACRYRPLQRLAATEPSLRMRGLTLKVLGERLPRLEKLIVKKAEALANSRLFRPIPRLFNQAPTDFVFCLVECSIVYNIALPFLLPLNIFLVAAAVRWSAQRTSESAADADAFVE